MVFWRAVLPASLLLPLACSGQAEGDAAASHDRSESTITDASPVWLQADREANPAEQRPNLENPSLEQVSDAEKSSRAAAIPPKPPVDLSTVFICLERTECLGWCPNYRIMISGDGRVRYLGRSYVREMGDREGLISEASVRELLGKCEQARFFDLAYSYEENVTDLSSTIISVQAGTQRNHVENYWMGDRVDREVKDRRIHADLDSLAEAIDCAVQIEHWIGTEEERRQLFQNQRAGYPGAR
jgi:hypothetical protein